MAADKPLLICLMGPTGAGKTDLAIGLAGKLDCELVSVDSALVYRGMEIGTARPDYLHHLVGIRDPARPYSAADFVADARPLVEDIVARGRTPLLVGGTMLYFRAFLEGLAAMPAADPAVRAGIAAEAAAHGWPHIHRQLAAVDPGAAARIHPHHSQRLSRALEVYRVSGQPLSAFHGGEVGAGGAADRYRIVQIALCPVDRAELHRRIEQRFWLMMEAGLLEEVRRLRACPDLHGGLPAARAVGYRQLWRHLEGESTLETAVEQALAATRQLAKRQLTWLRKWPDLVWIMTDQEGNVAECSFGDGRSGDAGEPPLSCALRVLGGPLLSV